MSKCAQIKLDQRGSPTVSICGRANIRDGISIRLSPGCYCTNLISPLFRKPDVPIRAKRDTRGSRVTRGNVVFGELAFHRDDANFVRILFIEPESAIGTRSNIVWEAATAGNRILRDISRLGVDLADFVSNELGEPQVLISLGSLGKLEGITVDCILLDLSRLRVDLADLVRTVFSEPETTRPGNNTLRPAITSGNGILCELTAGRDLANLVSKDFAKPDVVIRSSREIAWPAVISGNRILCELAAGGGLTNLVPIELGKPDISIRTNCNASRFGSRSGYCVFCDLTTGSDDADSIPTVLGKPEIVVRPSDDMPWRATAVGQGILGNLATDSWG